MAKSFDELKADASELFEVFARESYGHIGTTGRSFLDFLDAILHAGPGLDLFSEFFDDFVLAAFSFGRRFELDHHLAELGSGGGIVFEPCCQARGGTNGGDEVFQLAGLGEGEQWCGEDLCGANGFVDAVAEGQLVADLELSAIALGEELLLDGGPS